MQGQRGSNDSFSEFIDIDEGSVSNSTGMSDQPSWNNILNPVESRLSNFTGFSNEAACVNGNDRRFGGWDAGESSSRLNPQRRIGDDGMKAERGWPSSFDPRAEERRSEPSNIFFPGRVNIGSSSNQITRRPIVLQSSGSAPYNVNQSAGYAVNSRNGNLVMGNVVYPNLYKPVQSKTDHVGTSSGSSGYIEESDGSGSSALGGWGLSSKRKILEDTSGQSYPGGSSSSFPQTESIGWPAGPPGSLNLSAPSWNSPSVGPPEHLNSGFGPSNVFPTLSVTEIAENPPRNFGRRVNQEAQQGSIPFNLSSSRSAGRYNVHSSDSSGSRAATAVIGNSSATLGQSRAIRVTGMSRDMHHFPWNDSSNPRASSSSSTLMPGDRGSTLLEEPDLRTISRNSVEHPVFVHPPETRSFGQDPTSFGQGVPSSARLLPNPAWTPHHNLPTQELHRLSEFSPWSLFPSVDSESGGPSVHHPQFPPAPSASSQETALSSRLSQGHRQPYPRSAFLTQQRHRDDVLGPHSLRVLAADIEGRHRLISEIRQVLSAMRRGENLRAEDFMLFDPFIYHGMADMHDRHRDMRLDVDNMSYEELLALEERIGDVSTGLTEETILKSMKQREFISTETPSDLEPCCICQDQYCDGDKVGTLDCGHDFHTECVKQWLTQKNLCPICKTKALQT